MLNSYSWKTARPWLAAALLLALAGQGCGGGHTSGTVPGAVVDGPAAGAVPVSPPLTDEQLHASIAAPESGAQAFRLTVDPASFELGGTAAGFKLELVADADGLNLFVRPQAAQRLKALYLQLDYDPQHYHPVSATPGDALPDGADQASLLRLAVLDEPGVVHFGEVYARPAGHAGYSGSGVLAVVRFAAGAPTAAVRRSSLAPTTNAARSTLDCNVDSHLLTWDYANPGDYSQNSIVSLSDLTPLAVHFGETAPGGADEFEHGTVQYIIDTNADAQIGIADLTAIGVNYSRRVARYNVYQGTQADIPASNNAPSTLIPVGWVSFAAATGDPAAAQLQFTFLPPAPTDEAVFWVRPVDTNLLPEHEGTPSRPDGGDVVVLAENVKIMGPDSGIELVSENAPGNYLIADPPGGEDLAVGDVIVGVYEIVDTPEFTGILGHIDTITPVGADQFEVLTTPAALNDVFLQGGIKRHADMLDPIIHDLILREPCSPPAPGERKYRAVTREFVARRDAQEQTRRASASNDISINLSGQRLIDLNDGAGNYFRVGLEEGTFNWDAPGIDVSYDAGVKWCESFIGIDYPCGVGLKYFRAAFGGGVASDLVIEAQGHYYDSFHEEKRLYELKDYYIFFLGPVPVEMSVLIDLDAGVTGDAGVDVYGRAGYHMNYSMYMGVQYQGGWSTFFEPTTMFTAETPQLNANGYANIFAYVNPEVEVRFYEAVGGSVALTAGVDGHVDGAVDIPLGAYCLNWDINAKLSADLRLFAELFGFSLFDKTWNLYDGTFDIAAGQIGCGVDSPPNVVLIETNYSGWVPKEVNYDADGTNDLNPLTDTFDPDGGAIVNYSWDLDGDGYCELDTGADGHATFTYNDYDVHYVSVWVTDDEGMVVKKTIAGGVVKPPS